MLLQNALADALNNSEWAFPLAECIHIGGFAVGIGSIALVDFRMLNLGLGNEPAARILKYTEPWTLAEAYATAGLDSAFVQEVADAAGSETPSTLRWIAASLSARHMANELAQSTKQMGKLVKAVKKFAYMDRGDVVSVDLAEDIENVLTMLFHKLKKTTIEVKREYDDSLGPVTAYGGELNMVWMNLIKNAVDALGETGTITITTRADGDCAEVERIP